VTALSLLAALIFSSILQRLITVPLEKIGDAAKRIVEDHDYSIRVEQHTEDEIGVVVLALNNMLNVIDERTRALELSNAALREADRKKDEFLATLAHELRNPLAPLQNAARILESDAITDSQRKWSREVIARQVGHMALLLNDLLDVSRITRDRLELKMGNVSLDAIIRSAVEIARPLIDAKKHLLEIIVPPEEIELIVDSLRMSQVVTNLLTNAAKYSDAGGTITIKAARESNEVSISVKDTGIGLSAAAIENIFEMFSQVESALERSQGGLGIGLALARGLVELHGGTIHATSDGPGFGSTFTIRLPAECIVQK
jgi:signal transduction histidine kinase